MTSASHIEALLKERMGLDAATIGAGTVERALRERMTAASVDDHPAYWNLLHARPEEFQALIEAVIVPETWFFRHREGLLTLARFAAAQLFKDAGPGEDRTIRVLSLPCSTGEEPYSIAMALLDAGLPADRFRVDAVDISARSLARAAQGEYGANSFRGAPLDFRQRHFTQTALGYLISERVRAQVSLLQGNLLDPALPASAAPYHFVFCRNLLIYFDAQTQRRALAALDRLTRASGALFVGPAEASLLTHQGFVSAGVPLAFAFFKPGAQREPAPAPWTAPAVQAQAVRRTPVLPRGKAPPRMSPRAAVPAPTHMPLRVPPRPSTAQPPAIAAPEPDPLASIGELADRGEIDAAIAACRAHLDAAGPSAAAFCLQGVLYDAKGRPADAREAYRKTLYLDPAHQEALYHLAALLEADGDSAGAGRLRQRAQRATRPHHG